MRAPWKMSDDDNPYLRRAILIVVAFFVLLAVCVVCLVIIVVRTPESQSTRGSSSHTVSEATYYPAMVDDPVIGPALADPLPDTQSRHGELTQSLPVTVVGWRDGSQAALGQAICFLTAGARLNEVAALEDNTTILEYTGGPAYIPFPTGQECQVGALFVYAPGDGLVTFYQLA